MRKVLCRWGTYGDRWGEVCLVVPLPAWLTCQIGGLAGWQAW